MFQLFLQIISMIFAYVPLLLTIKNCTSDNDLENESKQFALIVKKVGKPLNEYRISNAKHIKKFIGIRNCSNKELFNF